MTNRPGLKLLDPHEAVIAVGKQNSELIEEQARLHAEIDFYRVALTEILNMSEAEIAANPRAPRVVATVGLSHGRMNDPPEPQQRKIIIPGGRA